jgi:hypothetical protein
MGAHFLTAEQKQNRVQMAIELLQVLSVARHRHLGRVVNLFVQ